MISAGEVTEPVGMWKISLDAQLMQTKAVTLTMAELVHTPVNMFTTVFIGNSQTKIIDGKLVTPRGYHI